MGDFDKKDEFVVPEKNPFENDLLNREEIIVPLTRLITSMDKSFVLSVESSWGQGKTTFIRMWKQHLANEGYFPLYFNAWENDFFDDPLSAFVSSMLEQIGLIHKNIGNKQTVKKIRKLAGKIAKKTVPILLGALTKGIVNEKSLDSLEKAISDDQIVGLITKEAEDQIELFEERKKANDDFKAALQDLITQIEEKNHKLPLIIFIDELDRCKPDFALLLLERVKHLFSNKNIVFVLSIDRNQIETSIKSIYGIDHNAKEYLRRFIDLSVNLQISNDQDRESFIKYWFTLFQLHTFFSKHNGDTTYYIRLFQIFSNNFPLSLRAIEQTISELNIIIRTVPLYFEKSISWDILIILLLIKAVDHMTYQEFQSGVISSLDKFEKRIIKINQKDLNDLDWGWFYGQVVPKDQISKVVEDLNNSIIEENNVDFILTRKLESLQQRQRTYPPRRDNFTLLINVLNLSKMMTLPVSNE